MFFLFFSLQSSDHCPSAHFKFASLSKRKLLRFKSLEKEKNWFSVLFFVLVVKLSSLFLFFFFFCRTVNSNFEKCAWNAVACLNDRLLDSSSFFHSKKSKKEGQWILKIGCLDDQKVKTQVCMYKLVYYFY